MKNNFELKQLQENNKACKSMLEIAIKSLRNQKLEGREKIANLIEEFLKNV